MREVVALVKSSVAVVTAEENTASEDVAVARGRRLPRGARAVGLRASPASWTGWSSRSRPARGAGDATPSRCGWSSPTGRWRCCRCSPTASDPGGGALLVHESGLLDALLAPLRPGLGVVQRGACPLAAGVSVLDARPHRGRRRADPHAAARRPHRPGDRRSARDVPAHGPAAGVGVDGPGFCRHAVPARARGLPAGVGGGVDEGMNHSSSRVTLRRARTAVMSFRSI